MEAAKGCVPIAVSSYPRPASHEFDANSYVRAGCKIVKPAHLIFSYLPPCLTDPELHNSTPSLLAVCQRVVEMVFHRNAQCGKLKLSHIPSGILTFISKIVSCQLCEDNPSLNEVR